MFSSAFEHAVSVYEAVDDALDRADAVDLSGLSHPERLALLEHRQRWRSRLPAGEHGLITELSRADRDKIGGAPHAVLATRLRISRGQAARRIAEAADLNPRTTLTGDPLPPVLEHTAAGQRAGHINAEHISIIRAFFDQLPAFVHHTVRAAAERDLAAIAAAYRPDELQRFANHLMAVLNPDGTYSDEDRARRRGLTVGPQRTDGMSRLTGWLSPELRAGLDALLAKLAAPGMSNPADEHPTIAGVPTEEAVNADTRTTAQRNHDALNAMTRAMLMSGDLGSHQGLPVTIVATVTLQDLQKKTGLAHTGGGTSLPVTDLLRMSGQAYNYLLLFDKARPCQLFRGRTTRLATAAQRLVLYATERGCTHPGCDIPAYWCQVHHANGDWARGGRTDITDETLACAPHNRDATDDGWTTRKPPDGSTEWIPPPHLDHGQARTNTYFHPENMLGGGEAGPGLDAGPGATADAGTDEPGDEQGGEAA